MPSGSIRIGIDARTLGAARITGVERYVRSLITHLAAIAELPECLLYVDSPEIATTPPIALGTSMRMRLVSPGRAWLRLRLPLALRADRVAVMHFPATVLPRLLPCPSVVTVHDLAFEFHPECYDPADLRMQLQGARRSIKRATSVLAVSQSTADDVIRLYRRDRENITVTREGVDERFLAPGPTDPPPGWPDSYVLYVGSLAPRKNLASLLEAYAEARAQGIPETLVLAGAGPPDYVAALRSEAVALGIIEDVIFSGYLADDLLPAAYANARAFVYLSLYEG
ncbi:MAG: glycosyltransferase family 4 protein, partial [Armatimonadota bacterium]